MATSRTDNVTKICQLCGMAEAVEVAYGHLMEKDKWYGNQRTSG